MKDEFIREGIKGIKKIQLSPEEKGVVFSRILAYMNENPAAEVLPQRSRIADWFTRISGPFGAGGQISGLRLEYVMAGVLVVLVAGSGAVTAAEKALPGDVLYSVKIHVNEPVRGVIVQGAVPKAHWEAEKTVRRLEEAESLAAEGRLTHTSVESIKEDFEKSANEFNAAIQASESSGPSEDIINERVDFEAQMKAHSQILSTIEDKTKIAQENDGLSPLRSAVEEKANAAWQGRVNAVEILLKNSEGKNGRGAATANRTEVQKADQRSTLSTESKATDTSVQRVFPATTSLLDPAQTSRRESQSEERSREMFDARAQSVETAIRETENHLNAATSESAASSSPPVQKDILENIPETLKTAEDALKDARGKKDSGDSSSAFSALLDSESAAKQADTSLERGLQLGEEEKGRSRSRELRGRLENTRENGGNGDSRRDSRED
ncbi:MAG: DUF5667 domain-containing protein [bacterium]|nr:DUF5667 domain-containing protein [bacterium]